uniref:Uncharacterized protein n=1 Tax=Chenopodium quinoa TaxID=63459 RepID=A0A803MGZ3_CHEQI
MEQMPNQNSLVIIPNMYPSSTAYTNAYPPHFNDTMATNYVQYLTSTPYYYFIPHTSHSMGYHNPSPHYVHDIGSQLGFSRVGTTPVIGVPYYAPQIMNNSRSCSNMQELLEGGIDHADQIEKLDGNMEGDYDWMVNENLLVNPRIINMLEPFRHLYSESEESLKNIFPSLYSKLSEFFKKVNSLIMESITTEKEKSSGQTLKRSLSLGSSPTCKNERFKVRPIDSEDVNILIPPESMKDGDKGSSK